MKKKELRTFHIDGDSLEIVFRYDEDWKVWLGEYPYFKEEPRFTPSGRPWRNAIHEGCPFVTGAGGVCGCCEHLKRQSPGDLIGVCFHHELQQCT